MDGAVSLHALPDAVRAARMTTDDLRASFLVQGLFESGTINLRRIDLDRVVLGGAVPTGAPLTLEAPADLLATSFCERRELGVLNIGGTGTISVDGTAYALGHRDLVYVSRGSRDVVFASDDAVNPARFYLVSYPAHAEHPTTLVTMPAHTHDRRTEIYLYFDVAEDAVVFHQMGEPTETRHLIVRDGEAVLSPGWSIHAGCGTSSYAFCWAMGGENQDYADMQVAHATSLR